MISAGAMGYHEKWCASNPVNYHPCTAGYCAFLEKEGSKGDISFYCSAQKNKPLYSYKLIKALDRRRYGDLSREKILAGKELMPKDCAIYSQHTKEELELIDWHNANPQL